MDDELAVSETIRRQLDQLPQAERRVARGLLSGTPTVGLGSSTKLAEAVGASGPTVIRFVNRLGYPTYSAFQAAWRKELDSRLDSPVSMYRRHRAGGDAALRERNADVLSQSVHDSLQQLAPGELEAAIRLLADRRRRVVAFGGWFSHLLARHLVALLQEVRPRTHLLDTAPSQRAALLVDAGRSDVAVAFDFRRYETDTLAIARLMADKGAQVVLLTDQWLSPVAAVAGIVLTARVPAPGPFESLVPGLAVLEALVTGVVDALGDAAGRRLESFTEIAGSMIPSWAPASGLPPAGAAHVPESVGADGGRS